MEGRNNYTRRIAKMKSKPMVLEQLVDNVCPTPVRRMDRMMNVVIAGNRKCIATKI